MVWIRKPFYRRTSLTFVGWKYFIIFERATQWIVIRRLSLFFFSQQTRQRKGTIPVSPCRSWSLIELAGNSMASRERLVRREKGGYHMYPAEKPYQVWWLLIPFSCSLIWPSGSATRVPPPRFAPYEWEFALSQLNLNEAAWFCLLLSN